MPSPSSQPKSSSLNLRQDLLGSPSASFLAFALFNAAALNSTEAAPPPAATPAPAASPEEAAPGSVPDRADWMSQIIIEDKYDSYKPERANLPKRSEPLLDTPQSISVVPQAVIRDQNATNLRDILRNVPGITIQAGEGGATPGDNFIIRGFSARTDVYVNGTRDINGFYRDPFNIEQVEVTRGPASVYTGRGSTGGSINVITKTPLIDPLYAASAGIGTDGYNRESIDINLPLPFGRVSGDGGGDGRGSGDTSRDKAAPAAVAPDRATAAVRLNAFWHTNEVPGRDETAFQRWGIAPSIGFGLGTPTQLTLSYMHLDQNNMPDFGIPWVTATNNALPTERNKPAPVSFSNYYGLNQRDHEFLRTDEVTAIVSQDFGDDLNLRYTFHYGRNYRDSIISAPRFISNDSTDINREFQSRDEIDSVLTDEIDLTWRVNTFGISHTVISGLEHTHETFENRLRSNPAAPLADLFNPDVNDLFTGQNKRTGAVNEADTLTLAAYLFDTIKIGKQWQASGGVRFDYFDADYDVRSATGDTVSFNRVDRLVSWRGALLYKPVESGTIYFGAGTSFNPSAEGLVLSAATVGLRPEKTTTYELGTKWEVLNRQLALNAAVFYTLKEDARTPGLTPADPVTVLAGEQQALGYEIEFKGMLTRDWEVFGGYSYTDTQIKESNTPAEVGSELPGVPRHAATLWTVYHFPLGFEAGFGAQYVSERFANFINTRNGGDYYTLDAMAAYHVNKHFTVRLNVYNFTDEEYISGLHIQGSYGHFIPGVRRAATLTANVQF